MFIKLTLEDDSPTIINVTLIKETVRTTHYYNDDFNKVTQICLSPNGIITVKETTEEIYQLLKDIGYAN